MRHVFEHVPRKMNHKEVSIVIFQKMSLLLPIVVQENHVDVIDQLKLPLSTEYIKVSNTQEAWDAIRNMNIRGAPAIGLLAVLGYALELKSSSNITTHSQLSNYTEEKYKYLLSSRPTAVNIRTLFDIIVNRLELFILEKLSVTDIKLKIIEMCKRFVEEDVEFCRSMGRHGVKAVLQATGKDKVRMLTHCNTGSLATGGYGTALGVIRRLHETKTLTHAYCTETRPYNQGARLTAHELTYEGIPSTLVCDSAVGALMQAGKVDAVVVGADRIAANGDTANKIGTYQLAVVAKHHNVPFFVVAPGTTIDGKTETGSDIKIEERPAREMIYIKDVQIAPATMNCWNPAFDVTPRNLITAIITDTGVCGPNNDVTSFIK